MEFDRTLRDAEALAKRPAETVSRRTTLNDAEIKRMAEYVYAKTLAWDERVRFGRDEWKRQMLHLSMRRFCSDNQDQL